MSSSTRFRTIWFSQESQWSKEKVNLWLSASRWMARGNRFWSIQCSNSQALLTRRLTRKAILTLSTRSIRCSACWLSSWIVACPSRLWLQEQVSQSQPRISTSAWMSCAEATSNLVRSKCELAVSSYRCWSCSMKTYFTRRTCSY